MSEITGFEYILDGSTRVSNEELLERYRSGELQLRNEIILNNTGLIRAFIWKNSWLFQESTSLTEEDFFQEGILALYEAIEKYDKDRGSFSSYAFMVLRMKLYRAYHDKSKAIRIPSGRYEEFINFRKKERAVNDHLGRDPSTKELSRLSGYSIDEIMAFRNDFNHMTSLNTPLSDEADSGELGDTLMDSYNYFEDVEKDMVMKDLKNNLDEILEETLDEAERKMLCSVLGWYNKNPKNYTQVSEKFGLSSPEVQRSTRRSLIKIRKLHSRNLVDEYYGLIDYELKKHGPSDYDESTRGRMLSSVIRSLAENVEAIIINGYEGRISEWYNSLYFSFDYIDMNGSERSIYIEFKWIKGYSFNKGRSLLIQVDYNLD